MRIPVALWNYLRMRMVAPLFLFAVYSSAQHLHARIQVIAVGGPEWLSSFLQKHIAHELEETDGIIATKKEPDYLLILNSDIHNLGPDEEEITSIVITVEEVLEKTISDRLILRSVNPNYSEYATWVPALLRRTAYSGVIVGKTTDLNAQCVELIRRTIVTLEADNLHPRGDTNPDVAFMNFMLRCGAKLVKGGN